MFSIILHVPVLTWPACPAIFYYLYTDTDTFVISQDKLTSADQIGPLAASVRQTKDDYGAYIYQSWL